MNARRADCFRSKSDTRLKRVDGWPSLPPNLLLDRVVGVAVDSRGFVYVAHRGDRPLLCLDPEGRLVREVGADRLRKSVAYDLRGPTPIPIATRTWMHGLHVDPWDNVWVTDVGRHLVMKFGPSGDWIATLGVDGVPGCSATHFAQPTQVCVMPSGEFFVTDGYGNSRIVKFDPNGNYLFEWGVRGTGPGEFHTPHTIVLGLDGLLYVTDRDNDRIQVFTQDGKLAKVWSGLHSVDGLFAATDGFLYGSGGIDDAILRFDPAGRVLDIWAEPGALAYPHAVAMDAAGALYAAETGDRWVVTGPLPEERSMAPRVGAEGSRISKWTVAPRDAADANGNVRQP